ncbi:hypothetical protein H1C71_018197, partial [Ictidomys tridecemlineatus]
GPAAHPIRLSAVSTLLLPRSPAGWLWPISGFDPHNYLGWVAQDQSHFTAPQEGRIPQVLWWQLHRDFLPGSANSEARKTGQGHNSILDKSSKCLCSPVTKKSVWGPGLVAYACNPSSSEALAGGSRVQSQAQQLSKV